MTGLDVFIAGVRGYLVNTHGFCAADANDYIRDREKFRTPFQLGWSPAKTVDLDLGSFIDGDSELGDGRFA
jgi:hypothetical protein